MRGAPSRSEDAADVERREGPPGRIEIQVAEIDQLFDTLDPFPFRERDLDKDAEEFIVGWAREFPRNQHFTIVVHIPESELAAEPARELGAAISQYFNYRARIVEQDLKELFRVGRTSLVIGLAVLAVCMLAAQAIAAVGGDGNVSRFTHESLIILGWVANWKPIEIFLYDWWPLARRRNLYRRLAAAEVTVTTTVDDRDDAWQPSDSAG